MHKLVFKFNVPIVININFHYIRNLYKYAVFNKIVL